MKLLRLSTVYPAYLKQFYDSRPGLEKETFTRQEEALMYDAFGWADFWKEPLALLGYDVTEVVANAGPLQRAWSSENGCRGADRGQLHSLAAARIRALAPDILFINDYVSFNRAWIEDVRSKCHSIRLVLGWCGAPFPDPEVFKAYDSVLSCVPELVETFRQMGHVSHHLNHAFDPRVLDRIAGKAMDPLDFTFVGQVNRQSGFHRHREDILLHLVNRTPLTIFSLNSHTGPAQYLMAILRKCVYMVHKNLVRLRVPAGLLDSVPVISRGPGYHDHPLLPVHPALKKHLRPPAFGLEMFRVLRDSAITLNSHLNISVHSSSNMRMFESTGAGACLLTDQMENISRLFEPDTEVITYNSAEECAEKALYLLEHPDERKKVALAGQKRTLREHTFGARAHDLDRIVRTELQKKY